MPICGASARLSGLNLPVEGGKVTDLTRLQRTAPTILEIADRGGKVIPLSHFGRPKERNTAAALAEVLGRRVAFAEDCTGPVAEAAVSAMKDGDILSLENTRFHRGEEENDPAFVDALAALGDIWVSDAFSVAHRAHATSEGLGHKLLAYAGRGMEAELRAITAAL
jgi:phosphoglycerate kinase